MTNKPNLLCPHLLIYKRPENNYYFPDLHHMKYEIEDGTTPDGRELRFGFDPLEFPEFSWRGYTQMSSVQVCSLQETASVQSSPDTNPQHSQLSPQKGELSPELIPGFSLSRHRGLGQGWIITDQHRCPFHSSLLL